MNKNEIPTPQDEDLRLEAAGTTKVANFNGTAGKAKGIGAGSGGIGLPMAAVVNVTAADRTSSDETYTFTLQESADAGANWYDIGPGVAIDVAGALATLGAIAVPGFISYPDVRVKLVVAGTTPSITYEAWLNPNVR
jgi:hypothetical protein